MINECVQGGIADTLTTAFYGLQMSRYLSPYLQPYNMLDINVLWRYLGPGCRWQIKMKTIFCSWDSVEWGQLRLNWSVTKALRCCYKGFVTLLLSLPWSVIKA